MCPYHVLGDASYREYRNLHELLRLWIKMELHILGPAFFRFQLSIIKMKASGDQIAL